MQEVEKLLLELIICFDLPEHYCIYLCYCYGILLWRRIAKRKLDESVFLGNRLHVSYAPEFESPSDTKEKLEGRKKEVINRVKCEFLSFFFKG